MIIMQISVSQHSPFGKTHCHPFSAQLYNFVIFHGRQLAPVLVGWHAWPR
jgi:hypothetical protein